jgi:hypothetical protein
MASHAALPPCEKNVVTGRARAFFPPEVRARGLARQAVRTIPLQWGSHRERGRAKSDGTTSAAAFALCGGDPAEVSKDWRPGGKGMNLRPVLHLRAGPAPEIEGQELAGPSPASKQRRSALG